MTSSQKIGNVKVEMHDTDSKTYEIADWFHTHYSHAVKNKKEKERLREKAEPTGYFEEDHRIYVIE